MIQISESIRGVQTMSDEIQSAVKEFILREFLPGEDPNELQDDTPLITGGILDSIATLKLVAFLEEQFSISVAAHEADVDHLNTVSDIARLVRSKRGTKS
jgi:acyl carrier protein